MEPELNVISWVIIPQAIFVGAELMNHYEIQKEVSSTTQSNFSKYDTYQCFLINYFALSLATFLAHYLFKIEHRKNISI